VVRRFPTFAITALAMATMAPAAYAAHSARRLALAKCAPRHTRVLLANAQAELYTRRVGEETSVFGCARGYHRVYNLGEVVGCSGGGGGGASCGGIRLEQLAGPVVAFEEVGTGGPGQGMLLGESASWVVVVRDLTNGRVLHKVHSLTLAANKLTWTQGGKQMSASLS
jgi:hypothetical protein